MSTGTVKKWLDSLLAVVGPVVFTVLTPLAFFSVGPIVAELAAQFKIERVHLWLCLLFPFAVDAVILFSITSDSYKQVSGRVKLTLVTLHAAALAVVVAELWEFYLGVLLYSRVPAPGLYGFTGFHVVEDAKTAVAIGGIVAVPIAIRIFWSRAPWYMHKGRLQLHHRSHRDSRGRLFDHSHEEQLQGSPLPRSNVWPREVNKLSGGAEDPARGLPATGGTIQGKRFLTIGILVGLGTFCGIIASISAPIRALQFAAAVIASFSAGLAASLQWRATSRR